MLIEIFCDACAMLAAMLEQLEDNLWRAEARVPKMPLHRVMTVAKLASGGLVVHSAIALPDYAELDALGAVKFIVVPNGWHRMDAKAYVERYPEAKVLAPPGSKKKISKVVPVTGELSDLVDRDVALTTVAGTKDLEALMTVRSGERTTLVFTDAIFNMPHKTGFQGFVLKHVMGSSGGPRVSRIGKMFMVKDKPAFAAQLEQLAARGVTRVVVSHHEVISVDAAGALRDVASSLR
ncbi:MAG: hypothetical protein ABJE66_14985 [Deltaproteobacteria bacterium]